MGLPTQPIPNSATKLAPYGTLKVSLILMTIAVAWGVLVIASATQLGADWLTKISGLLLLAMIGTGYWVKRTWFEIIRIEAEPTFRFCAIGLFIGVLSTSRSAPAFVNILYQVMMHLSGLFYPLPKFLRTIADLADISSSADFLPRHWPAQ